MNDSDILTQWQAAIAELAALEKRAADIDRVLRALIETACAGRMVGWDEAGYLAGNPAAAELVRDRRYASGLQHYLTVGRGEGCKRGIPIQWNEKGYLAANPDVASAVAGGLFADGLQHYQLAGLAEGRVGGFGGWDEEGYLIDNPIAADAVKEGAFRTGFEYFLQQCGAEPDLASAEPPGGQAETCEG